MKVTKEDIIKRIKECIQQLSENKDSGDPDDPTFDDNEEEKIDQEIEGKPLDDDDVWAGSDVGGVKVGGTAFPHGFGFPNNPFRRGRKLRKEDLEKILRIDQIEGVSDTDKKESEDFSKKMCYHFINKNCPWVFTYGYKIDYNDEMNYPFSEFFTNKNQYVNWLEAFDDTVRRQLTNVKYWLDFPPEKLKGAYKYNRHWISQFKWARKMVREYPKFEEDLNKVLVIIQKLAAYSPSEPKNPRNYPIFVSLYDVTRRMGGHEEGGWWYDKEDPIKSIQVKTYKDARKAVMMLLKMMGRADLDGKPLIVFEKEEGIRGNKPPPTYS